jgi:hypothetical protein
MCIRLCPLFLSIALCRLTAQVAPVAAVTDHSGVVHAFKFSSSLLVPADGMVGIASAAQNSQGDTYVTGVAGDGTVWLNIFRVSESWSGWVCPGGPTFRTTVSPAIAIAPDGTAWIAALDAPPQGVKPQYWLIDYVPAQGFGSWVPLGTAAFQTSLHEPLLAVTKVGTVYVLGSGNSREDNIEMISIGTYIPGNGFTGWSVARRSIVPFVPFPGPNALAAASVEDAVYVASLDSSSAIWMARFSASGWGNWYTAPGVFTNQNKDFGPKLATGNGRILAASLDPNGGVWVNSFMEGANNGWGTWTYANGILEHFAVAAVQDELYIAGQSSDSVLWWYSSASGWRPYGQASITHNSSNLVTAAPH